MKKSLICIIAVIASCLLRPATIGPSLFPDIESISKRCNVKQKVSANTCDVDDVVASEINGLVFLNDDVSIELMDYQFYRVPNYKYSVIYTADVINGITNPECKGVTTINFTNGESDNYMMEIIQCIEGKLYSYKINELSSNILNHIITGSIDIEDIYKEAALESQLLESLNFKTNFILKCNQSEEQSLSSYEMSTYSSENSTYANENKTVHFGDFDSYTSTDGIINQYATNDKYRSTKMVSAPGVSPLFAYDNPITKIIPKQLFKHEGIYSYIGSEYGFYINTKSGADGCVSNYIYFDIKSQKKAYAQNGIVEIIPLDTGYAEYYEIYDRVMASYGGSKLALANIDLTIGINNTNHKNIDDSDYVASEDYGYALSSYLIEANGSKKNSGSTFNSAFLKMGARALGFIPYWGTAAKYASLAMITAADCFFNNEYKSQNYDLTKRDDGTYVSNQTYLNNLTNTDTMIREMGNLNKGIEGTLKTNTDAELNKQDPLLYKVENGNKYKLTYNTIQRDSNVNWDSQIVTSLKVDIVEDNTYDILWWPAGDLSYKDSVEGSYAELYNEKPEDKVSTLIENKETFLEYAYNGVQSFSFTPSYSCKYRFETYGSNSDTVIELLQNGSLLKEDDDGGNYSNNSIKRCSLINYDLIAGTNYTIKVHGFSGHAGYTNLILTRMSNNLSETTIFYDRYCNNSYNGNSIWQEFIPTRSDYYSITTISNSDTYLKVYDKNHNQLAFDDDSGYSFNAKINAYFEAGNVYYIESRHYFSSTIIVNFGVIIYNEENTSLFEEAVNDGYSFNTSLTKDETSAVYFSLKPAITRNFELFTTCYGGYKDLYMYLLDSNFNLIAFNDDGNGNLQPKICYQLTGGVQYYVMIKQLNPSSGELTGFSFNIC